MADSVDLSSIIDERRFRLLESRMTGSSDSFDTSGDATEDSRSPPQVSFQYFFFFYFEKERDEKIKNLFHFFYHINSFIYFSFFFLLVRS